MLNLNERKINTDLVYLTFEPIEFSHIQTILSNLRSEYSTDEMIVNELEYVSNSLSWAAHVFDMAHDIDDPDDYKEEGGEEDEDEQ
jgi:hypothetical protein